MTTKEMKDILVEKFKDEKCGFTYKDISIRKIKDDYIVKIKDYEHIHYLIKREEDSYFGYVVFIHEIGGWEDDDCIIFVDSKIHYDYKTALIRLGYRIANTF